MTNPPASEPVNSLFFRLFSLYAFLLLLPIKHSPLPPAFWHQRPPHSITSTNGRNNDDGADISKAKAKRDVKYCFMDPPTYVGHSPCVHLPNQRDEHMPSKQQKQKRIEAEGGGNGSEEGKRIILPFLHPLLLPVDKPH